VGEVTAAATRCLPEARRVAEMRTERPAASVAAEAAEGTRRRVVDSEGPHTQFRAGAAAVADSVARGRR
jgi:hypothetical protein